MKSIHPTRARMKFVFIMAYFSTTNLSVVCATDESGRAHEGCNFMRNTKILQNIDKTKKG